MNKSADLFKLNQFKYRRPSASGSRIGRLAHPHRRGKIVRRSPTGWRSKHKVQVLPAPAKSPHKYHPCRERRPFDTKQAAKAGGSSANFRPIPPLLVTVNVYRHFGQSLLCQSCNSRIRNRHLRGRTQHRQFERKNGLHCHASFSVFVRSSSVD